MLSIGLDVHLRCSPLCILDGHGKKVKQMTIRGSSANLLKVLETLDHPRIHHLSGRAFFRAETLQQPIPRR